MCHTLLLSKLFIFQISGAITMNSDLTRRFRSMKANLCSTSGNSVAYRFMSIYPTASELTSCKSPHVLPLNITKGAYKDLDHYLRTHFMLLREDFIKPIREDLQTFLKRSSQTLINIKIHEVQFIRKGVKNSDVCVSIEIKKGVTYDRWNVKKGDKRFMLGSLLIFSADTFNTIICGKVADIRKLLYKKVLVSFEDKVNIQYDKTYLMIECNQFFEPYYHVLRAIQSINRTSFPLSEYLIKTNSSVGMPKYLNGVKWTISDQDLNVSQNIAMNAALSQELVIIQGPPGTGKTFLGLKIVKQLVTIRNKWWKNSPMLVISFTNHALDQFLEGLTKFTNRILRLGGQSRNPKMKNYSIQECRQRFYNNTTNGWQKRFKIGEVFKEYCAIERQIITMGNQLDNLVSTKPSCIFSFDVLATGVPEIASFFPNFNREEMVTWLLEEDESLKMGYLQISASEDRKLISLVYNNFLKDCNKDSKYCLLSVSIMSVAIHKLYDKILELNKGIQIRQEKSQSSDRSHIQVKNRELQILINSYNYLLSKFEFFQLQLNTGRYVSTNKGRDPFSIPVRTRWQLYQHWMKKYEAYMTEEMEALIAEYQPIYQNFNRIQEKNNLDLMKHQIIIGMTSTMAARMHSILEIIQCPIVIVEEAAELLEAHIIPVLTKHCQHVILIGDHKQLKPTTADYDIETKYNLGVSMFERMVRNDIQCYTLNVQHRMRPEISSLITPCIYPVLHNHETVTEFSKIRGMKKSLYFITHRNPEQSSGNSSKKNSYEAKYIIQLASHLIQNGYKPDEITILATYLGQVNVLMQEQSQCVGTQVQEIKVTSVDNFQGEENKIILLSLVRNNDYSSIGFLSVENRVCVALSRAKEGLYMMGNIKLLMTCSLLWRKIYLTLKKQNSVGFHLPLQCEQHSTVIKIRSPEQFYKLSPNGGCEELCNKILPCGHKCTQYCHFFDHKQYRCMEPCSKSSCKNPIHKCKKLCYEPCGMCTYKLRQKLSCGHYIRCFMDQNQDYRCLKKVYIRRSCGHKQSITCNEHDSDFEEDLDCSNCKISPAEDRKETSKASVFKEIKQVELGLENLTLGENLPEWNIKLPKAPELLGIILNNKKKLVIQGLSNQEILQKYLKDFENSGFGPNGKNRLGRVE
ncbi:NFX1-type zinc finger-containing protein 1-like isoform X2 [Euwallacea fornicatus]|uniref:NFX1-type zinc finger-containing protein 1-like isoform X2 n=1 Tax=Euwallacea fornicatus TaxID=995702 RepID=UPI00338F93D4